ncbi:MAG TPA: hypothetical protein VNH11_05850 [Pirellulales bacterium]|nr:hypothetical protein [Pirellulales bacterium]
MKLGRRIKRNQSRSNAASGVIAVRIAVILFLTHSLKVCVAQELPGTTLRLCEQADELVGEGKPLTGLIVLESERDKDPLLQQQLAVLRSCVGDWRGAHQAMDTLTRKPPQKAVPFSESVVCVSALDAIAEQARDHRIVIVNEAHHVPQHRAFILRLLPKLRAQGYKYYAAEALVEDDVQELKTRGYATRGTGGYMNEPVFGDVIREALALGLTPIAYEDTSGTSLADQVDDINSRETEQCRNLTNRLFSKEPDARVIVHVGYSHAMERPEKAKDGREIVWLAARLARATGSDPLTIDQTLHTERGDATLATPQWRQAVKNGWLDRPVVLRHGDGAFDVTGSVAGSVDMQVLHPPTKIIEGRPDWLVTATGRVAVSIPDEVRAESVRMLVQAFIQHESDDAIPFDQALLMPGEPRPKLLLKPGEYRMVIQDERGMEILRRPLVIASN